MGYSLGLVGVGSYENKWLVNGEVSQWVGSLLIKGVFLGFFSPNWSKKPLIHPRNRLEGHPSRSKPHDCFYRGAPAPKSERICLLWPALTLGRCLVDTFPNTKRRTPLGNVSPSTDVVVVRGLASGWFQSRAPWIMKWLTNMLFFLFFCGDTKRRNIATFCC